MMSKAFWNPSKLAAENLVLEDSSGGLVKKMKALDPHWIEDKNWSIYTRPPSSNSNIIGAVDSWISHATHFLNDIKCLLRMPHHIFWSNMMYNGRCMDTLSSFLQEAKPPYLPQHRTANVNNLYEQISKHVMIVFSRLVTNKESQECWLSKDYLGAVLYDNFIFSIPAMMDLCLIYGVGNKSHMERLISSVFQLQPKYTNDLETAVVFMKEVLKYIIVNVNKDFDKSIDPPNLPETFKGFREIRRPSDNASVPDEQFTFERLSDFIIYALDTVLTLRLFVEIYPKTVEILKKHGFVLSLAQFYENAVPSMCEKMEEFSDENDCSDLKNYVDMMRLEVIDLFKEILDVYKNNIFVNEENKELNIEEYLSVLMEGLTDKIFTRDYNAIYSVGDEIELLRNAYPIIVDPVKTDFILQAVYSTLEEEPPIMTNGDHIDYDMSNMLPDNQMSSQVTSDCQVPDHVREESLISEVKDIFPDLGDGFIQKCLQHFNNSTANVINCILEENLPPSLRSIDRSLPIIPEDPLDKKFLETGIARLNVFDGDEFDIMTRDDVDLTRIHVGKKKSKFKDAKDLLEDKSFVKERRDLFQKYNMVSDEEDRGLYSDEYDDTYDSDGGRAAPVTDCTQDEMTRRPFVKPRVLAQNDRQSSDDESYPEQEESQQQASGSGLRKPMDFCVNPELLRERREMYRSIHQKPKKSGDVVGKARGQGQEKEVLLNRERKGQNKSSRANHNRRAGATWKRSQGMMPS